MDDRVPGPDAFVIGQPRTAMTALSACAGVVPGLPFLAGYAVDGEYVMLVGAVVAALLGAAAFCGFCWWSFGRLLPPLVADSRALRFGLGKKKVIELPWESLQGVRVERAAFGHRVLASPVDLEVSLAAAEHVVGPKTTRFWRKRGSIGVGVGKMTWSTDVIVGALADRAGHQCLVTRR